MINALQNNVRFKPRNIVLTAAFGWHKINWLQGLNHYYTFENNTRLKYHAMVGVITVTLT